MRSAVYVETSIISYLAARPSRDLIVAARQQVTHTWWRDRRPLFDLYVSQVVLDEVRAGDPEAAERRVALLAGLPVLDITPEVAEVAAALIARVPLPPRAGADAAHIAVAAYHGIDFLLTWNSAHIANAELRPRVEQVCRESGYRPPGLCTPDELMGEDNARDSE
ncbi:MAG TPA: DNA-binding protein [Candidatus Rokubacteria bacterium]|nr:DNA-binding protein [Candidatus Rokubacteria bacterium]